MTPTEVETILRRELLRIAPEIDIDSIDRDADLRDEFDIDSIDFLNLITALSKHFGTEMPDSDYDQMGTFDALLSYLADKTR